jgi:asparagine synthase (glutamine-hydrolysing)
MCGIVGFVGPGSAEVLTSMTSALAHRGPDGAGYYIDHERAVYLGHRRLAVIDVCGGTQPMWNEDGSVGIIFNGEIYNHADLRKELVRAGHRFASDHSDTEVLVHGYEEWGEGLLSRLNGMYAFAIYDRIRNRLFLARDRFGEKPLYYWMRKNIFGFASEMQSLRAHPDFNEPYNDASLRKYFAYGFIPSPHCLWRNCYKLPGGCYLIHELATGISTVRTFWRFAIETNEAMEHRSEDDLAEELRELLRQAVQRRLISDVPIGVFLSGGIDSSAALAFAAEARGADSVDTFTIGFEEPSFDESAYARRMADFVRSRHNQEIFSMEKMRELIHVAMNALDEPVADPSIVPTYMLSRFARKQVTVALSGDGGDELFAGYDPFKALGPASLYARVVPTFAHQLLRKTANLLPLSTRNMSFDFKLRRTLSGLSYRRAFWNPVWLAPLEPIEIADLFTENVRTEDLFDDVISLWNEQPELGLEDQTLKFYTQFYLQDDILVKVDRAAMANSLETRAVFLDNDLVDFCRQLPYRFKFRNGRGKYILRKSLRGLMPEDLLDRRKKGFGIPVASWLASKSFEAPLEAIDGVDLKWVKKRWSEHRSQKADHRIFLWSWLSIQSVAARSNGAI